MPKRASYIGEAGIAGDGHPLIPMQVETSAYFARFSSAPSETYRNALNQAIFRWKQAGLYSLLQDLWLFVAGTQADSLRNLISASRDATINGSPTFTANRGFSGLGASNYVAMPFLAAGLSRDSGFIWAGDFNPSAGVGTLMGGGNSVPGSVLIDSYQSGQAVGPRLGVGSSPAFTVQNSFSTASAVIGAESFATVNPTTITGGGGSGGIVGSSPILANSGLQTRLIAYGTMPSPPDASYVRKFVSILNTFLDDVGALP